MSSYLKMMKRMVDLYDRYRSQFAGPTEKSDRLASFLRDLDNPGYDRLTAGLPSLLGRGRGAVPTCDFDLEQLRRLTLPDRRWDGIQAKVRSAPASLDLTDPDQAAQTFDLADLILDSYPAADELARVETRIVAQPFEHPTILHLALKLALSKMQLNDLAALPHLTVVVAMFKEHNRIRPKSLHPAGEDFIRRKVAELNWLYGSKAEGAFDLIFVDDGCPEKSGLIAAQIIEEEGYDNVRVLFLEQAIAAGSPGAKGLSSTDDSQKGGAVQYGLWEAIRSPHGNGEPVVLYTDADLSTNIAQTGLLLNRLADPKTMCALGSRYDPGGVYCTPAGAQGLTEHDRLRLILRHYVRLGLMPQLGPGVDTQCGFKAIKARALAAILDKMTDKGFSFDMELLLLITLNCDRGGRTVTQAPVVWIESNAESNFY